MLQSLFLQFVLLAMFIVLGIVCCFYHETGNQAVDAPSSVHPPASIPPDQTAAGTVVQSIPAPMLNLNEKSIINGTIEGLPVAGPQSTIRFMLCPHHVQNSHGYIQFATTNGTDAGAGAGEAATTCGELILVTADPQAATDLMPGDRVSIHAKLRSTHRPNNPRLPDSSAYYEKRNIAALAGAYERDSILLLGKTEHPWKHLGNTLLHKARSQVRMVLTSNGSENDPANQLMQALIMGDAQGIDQDLKQAFAATGTSHLLAVSGLHLVLVALFLYNSIIWLLKGFPRLMHIMPAQRMAALMAMAGAWMFTLFSGSQIPAIRSALMVSCNFAAMLLMRAPDPLSAISLAFLVLILPSPSVMFDVSFQLSFVAVLSLMLLMPRMTGGESAANQRTGARIGTGGGGDGRGDESLARARDVASTKVNTSTSTMAGTNSYSGICASHASHGCNSSSRSHRPTYEGDWSLRLLPRLLAAHIVAVARYARARLKNRKQVGGTNPDHSLTSGARAALLVSRGNLKSFLFHPGKENLTAAGKKFIRSVAALTVTSTVASLATIPLTASHFARFAPWAPFTNLLAVPLTCSILMPMLLAVAILSPIPAIAGLLAKPTELVSGLLAWLVKGMAALSQGDMVCPMPSYLLIAMWYLGLIMVFGTLAKRKTGSQASTHSGYETSNMIEGGESEGENSSKRPRHERITISAGIVIMVVVAVLLMKPVSPDQAQLELTFLDVGQGDSIVIRMPGGHTILVDGGSLTNGPDPGRTIITPYLKASGIRRINTLVLTHGHPDHCNGLVNVLDNFKVDEIWHPGGPIGSPFHHEFLERAEELAIPMIVPGLGPGSRLIVAKAGKAMVQVVHPLPYEPALGANDNSIVLLVTIGENRMLLTGDLEGPGEGIMMEVAEETGQELGWGVGRGKAISTHWADNTLVDMDVDLLKVGHHGSAGSTTTQLLDRINPEHAIICVGSRNTFGHPTRLTMGRLEERNVQIWRTDLHGAVTIRTTGNGLHIETSRQGE